MDHDEELRLFVECSPSIIANRIRPGRPLVLRLHVVVKDQPFPHPDWDDFVLPILTGWLQSIRSLLTGDKKVVLLRFMDGPYSIRLKIKDDQTLEFATLINEREIAGKSITGNVLVSDFARQLLEAAQHVACAVQEAGVQDTDTRALRDEIGQSKQVLKISSRGH